MSPAMGSLTSAKVPDSPLFIFKTKDSEVGHPLQAATLRNYFGKGFMANVKTATGTLADDYKQHSSRHAVCSALLDMGVEPSEISGLTLNSASTIMSKYVATVDREWAIPDCCQQVASLPLKLLIPFVHYHSTEGEGKRADGKCACSVLAFKASKE